MEVYLIRHGNTIANKKKIIQGHKPGKLSREGEKQVKLLGKHLANMQFDAIISSDLHRAVQTAKAIAKHQRGISIITTPLAKEAFLGSLENKPNSHFEKINWKKVPLDVETFESLLARSRILLKNLKKHYNGKKIVLVSHGGLGRAIIHHINGKKKYTDTIGSLENTSITQLGKSTKSSLRIKHHICQFI
jgi:broad specificity phosphatase PhoE